MMHGQKSNTDVINYILTSFKFRYEHPEVGTDMPKYVEVVK